MLNLDRLTQQYRDFRLGPITLEISEHLVGLAGANGAGKTTLFSALAGISQTDEGDVFLNGAKLSRLDRLSRVSLAHGRDFWYHGISFEAHLDLFRHSYANWDEDIARKALTRFAIPRKKLTGNASAGMLAKFALVVALARRADVALLDEPWNALDPGSRLELTQIVKSLASETGAMFIISSHDLHEIETLCERFIVLRDGALAFDGLAKDVAHSSEGGTLAELYVSVAANA